MAFSDLTCHLEDIGIGVFCCTVLSNSQETKFGSSNQEASPSAGKNTRIVLVPCRAWKCVPTAIPSGVNTSEVPGCHLFWKIRSQWGSQKLLHVLVSYKLTANLSVYNLFLAQWIVTILSEGFKPDNFQPHNSLKLRFTNVQSLCSNFVESESFHEPNSPDIFALHEKNLYDSIDSGNFSGRGYLPLIHKVSNTYTWSCNLFDRSTFFCMGLITRKLWRFLLMFLTGLTSLSVLFLFHLSIAFFVILHGFSFYFI